LEEKRFSGRKGRKLKEKTGISSRIWTHRGLHALWNVFGAGEKKQLESFGGGKRGKNRARRIQERKLDFESETS